MTHTNDLAKKKLILELAEEFPSNRFTPAEIEQIRRQLVTRLGNHGKTTPEFVIEVLEEAGMKVFWATREDSEELYEEEFHDLLHFATFEDAEMCLVRLDELLRKFQVEGNRHGAERALEVGRLGLRRAEMIARNHRVEEEKRAEKEEIANWFRIWLQTPDAFFDWLDIRKKSADFRGKFGARAAGA